jgi:hypothetical protein
MSFSIVYREFIVLATKTIRETTMEAEIVASLANLTAADRATNATDVVADVANDSAETTGAETMATTLPLTPESMIGLLTGVFVPLFFGIIVVVGEKKKKL